MNQDTPPIAQQRSKRSYQTLIVREGNSTNSMARTVTQSSTNTSPGQASGDCSASSPAGMTNHGGQPLSPSAFLRGIIQNVGDGIVVTDANDRGTLVSRAAESVFNALPDGLLRTDLKALLGADPDSVGEIAPEVVCMTWVIAWMAGPSRSSTASCVVNQYSTRERKL